MSAALAEPYGTTWGRGTRLPEDEMLMMDEEMMMDEEAPEAEAESELTDVADEDLVAELEARGFIVEAPEAEEADAAAGMEDE